MPATARPPLMPPAASDASADYLKGLSPAYAALRNGLAMFAVLVIVRFCARHLLKWLWPSAKLLDPVQSFGRLGKRHLRQQGTMGEQLRGGATTKDLKDFQLRYADKTSEGLTADPKWRSGGVDVVSRRFISRLPPAPPLTPPELSTSVFTVEDRAPHYLDSFIHQPNPDYMSLTSTSVSQIDSTSPTAPRRRSYTKTIPIGVPPASHTSSSLSSDMTNLTMSPSSYPPTSPLLPPAPPKGEERAARDAPEPRDIDVKGEILSAVDGDGAGWTRHTRVYGGGACLACAASGGKHGGGFYGATVTPEEMR